MPSHTIKCWIAGCEAVDVYQHRFPNPTNALDRFNAWIDILGSEELRVMNPAKVFKNRCICSSHFLPKYFSLGNPKLHRNAVPTLDMSESTLPPTSQSSEPEAGPSPFCGQVSEHRAHRETTPEYHGDILRSACVTRHKILTPKGKILYKTAIHWRKTALRSKRRHLSFKDRLAQAEKFAESNILQKMSVITPSTELFFKMQMRESQKVAKEQSSIKIIL